MSQKEFWWNSRSFPTRPSISWFAPQNWLGPRKSATKLINWHKKTTLTVYPERNFWDIKKKGYLTLNKSGKNTPMRLRSDFRAAITIMNRLHQESGEERAEPIPFQQYHLLVNFRGNRENCIANARRVTGYARKFTRGYQSLGPGSEKNWYGTHVSKLDGEFFEQ